MNRSAAHHEIALVTGATGAQGGAVVRALLDRGWAVRALVRDRAKPAARALEALGAQLVAGDLDDPDSLRAAARDTDAVFSVQPSDMTAPDPETEVRQGRNVADAAAVAGVGHLVYSSVGAAPRGSGVLHFETKAEIEAYIRSIGVPATVLRPVYFMENWRHTVPEPANSERIGAIALDADTPLQMIAVADIGRIAAEAFAHRGEFIGETIEIAGDELTVRQIAEAFTRADGIPTRFERQPADQLRTHAQELAKMYDWLDEHGHRADIAALRARFPELLTFEDWLRTGSRGR